VVRIFPAAEALGDGMLGVGTGPIPNVLALFGGMK